MSFNKNKAQLSKSILIICRGLRYPDHQCYEIVASASRTPASNLDRDRYFAEIRKNRLVDWEAGNDRRSCDRWAEPVIFAPANPQTRS
jgi:hypothetical protein